MHERWIPALAKKYTDTDKRSFIIVGHYARYVVCIAQTKVHLLRDSLVNHRSAIADIFVSEIRTRRAFGLERTENS